MAFVDVTGFQRARREQALRAAQEAELMQATKEQSAVEPPFDIDALTKNQIMAELDKREIEYNPRDNKETLKGLLLDAIN